MLGLLNTADKKCSTLIKYHKFKLDEDTGKIILIEEHSKCINVEYYIKNYGYYDESKDKNRCVSDYQSYSIPLLNRLQPWVSSFLDICKQIDLYQLIKV